MKNEKRFQHSVVVPKMNSECWYYGIHMRVTLSYLSAVAYVFRMLVACALYPVVIFQAYSFP